MPGITGRILIDIAFGGSLFALVGYFFYAQKSDKRVFKLSNWLFGLTGLLMLASSGILMYLLITHQFNYYYVYSNTSRDLQFKYLVSAFWSGQEGSFMLWTLWLSLVGLGLMKWVREPYRGPVLFFVTLNLTFLLSMIAGLNLGFVKLGTSPFRTLAEALANAPFIKANPGFVPADGNGLNELLQSPWMMLHPPVLFLGFSLMTVPCGFAVAALWKRKYREWIRPALPWTLAANLFLFAALLIGGYWAYVTLSFGGYWAWDPVENASLIPWLIGIAGIHTMLIQRKKSSSVKASLIFAILAYGAVVYETFLTRSGILGDASVHSFVGLHLYDQLIVFLTVIVGMCAAMLIYRYKDLPSQQKESPWLSRDFLTFSGAVVLALIGLVVIVGTSSPIIGWLFVKNPTPPVKSFYNQWSMPLAIIAAILTVLGQYTWRKRHDAESLSSDLVTPLFITSILSMITIVWCGVTDIEYMIYLFAAWFALIGNSLILYRVFRKKPGLIGGTLTHIGFAIFLIGILASSAYEGSLLDKTTRIYNQEVRMGRIRNKKGNLVMRTANFLELELNKPTVVNGKYLVTYEGYTLKDQERTGQQEYKIKFQRIIRNGYGKPFYLHPQIYPMLNSSTPDSIQWSVDSDIHSGFLSDIYLYASGSSYVERENKLARKRRTNSDKNGIIPVSAKHGEVQSDTSTTQKIWLTKDDSIRIGGFEFTLQSVQPISSSAHSDSLVMAVEASLEVRYKADDDTPYQLQPLYVILKKGGTYWVDSPPVPIPGFNADVQFSSIDPQKGRFELTLKGISKKSRDEWILITGKEKPLVSLVWLGTFILLIGFGISVINHGKSLTRKSSSHI